MHANQLHVAPQTVRRLVREQFPQWRERSVTELRTPGTVNAIFRIGDDLTARFPLVDQDPAQTRASLEAEAEASSELAAAATVPVPEPVVIGGPARIIRWRGVSRPGCAATTQLIPPNVLVQDGRLVGVLDGGGYGPADPALDLVSAWHLLDATRRGILRRELGCSEVQWRRGMAWAFQQAMGLVWYYLYSNPTMSRWGRRTLDRIVEALADPSKDGGLLKSDVR